MGLVAAKCPSCEADIQVPDTEKQCFCILCGSKILTAAAIAFAGTTSAGMTNAADQAPANASESPNRPEDFDIQAGRLVAYRGLSADVVVPDNVTEIGPNAFGNLPIRSIAINPEVKLIEDDLRALDSLEEIKLAGAKDNDSGYICNDLQVIYPRNNPTEKASLPSTIKWITLKCIYRLKQLTITESDRNASTVEIDSCPELEEIILPEKGIANAAITKCHSLKRIVIPAGNEKLQLNIKDCNSLEELDVSRGVGALQVWGCRSLRNIIVEAPIKRVVIVSCNGFKGCNGTTCYEFPAGTEHIEISLDASNPANEPRQLVLNPGCSSFWANIPYLDHIELREGYTQLSDGQIKLSASRSDADGRQTVGSYTDAEVVLPKSLVKVEPNNLTDIDFSKCKLTWANLDTAKIRGTGLANLQSKLWQSQGRCARCGGQVGGLFKRKCKECGWEA